MVALELMHLLAQKQQQEEGQAGTDDTAAPVMRPEEQLARWQLVVGADIGSVQYIPAVEELQVQHTHASTHVCNAMAWGWSVCVGGVQ